MTTTTAYIGTTVAVEADHGFRYWVTFDVTTEAESAEVQAYIARLEAEGVLSDVEVSDLATDEADADGADYEGPYWSDADADADALASAGYGTDEDYGYAGDEWLDAGADW